MSPDPRNRIGLPRVGNRPDTEMDEEIDAHLQLRIDDLVAAGLSPADARREAERRFGNLAEARRHLHRAARRRETSLRHRDLLGALLTDARFAIRQIRRHATHSALAIVTLALGIGATTATFTLIERLLLRPLPYPHPEQLVLVQGEDSLRTPSYSVSAQDGIDWRDQSHSFAGIAFHNFPFRYTATLGDSGVRLTMVSASGDFFNVIGSRFLLGRPFTMAEAQSHARVAVVSERTWRDDLGADPALTRPLVVDGRSYQVVGVVASGAEYPQGVGGWLPMAMVAGESGAMRNNINFRAIGRLKPGVTVTQATQDLRAVSRNIRARDAGGLYDFGARATPLAKVIVADDVTTTLRLLMGSVLVVLLLVCANLAIATLGRGSLRGREMAVRASLGASRARLALQLLVEHVMLALAGGIAGVVLAWVAVRWMVSDAGSWIPRATNVTLDVPVLLFAMAISIAAGVTAGVLPALRISRVSLQHVMNQGGRSSAAGRGRIARGLVIAEFALALPLLAGAGLLIHSFERLLGRDIGFNRGVATAEITMSGPRYAADSAQRLVTWDALVRRFAAIPGVERAGVANWVPLGTAGMGFIDIAGHDRTTAGAGYRVVSEDYLPALGVRLLSGRGFGPQDVRGGARTVVINKTMADRFWPKQDPIGQQVRARSMEAGPHGDADAPWLTVIGVVTDVRQFGLETAALPEMYVSFRQAPQWRTTNMTIIASSRMPWSRLLPQLRSAMHEVDPQLAADFSTMYLAINDQLAPRRLTMTVLGGFAALALVLAALGIYAVLSYSVVQRTRELSIRSALGAQRRDLLAMVVRSGAITAGIGMTAGLGATVLLSRLLESMLVDITALDPLAIVAAVGVLALAGVAAILVPARRATRLDPLVAMRSD